MNMIFSYIWRIVGNIEFVRHLFFFMLTVLLIPWILKYLQAKQEKRLIKALLGNWGGSCIAAIERLFPIGNGIIDIDGYGCSCLFWKEIRDGKREPKGTAVIIGKAFEKALYSEGEWSMKTTPPSSAISPTPASGRASGPASASKKPFRPAGNHRLRLSPSS